MKIRKVTHNNRRKAFEITTYGKQYIFPYSQLEVPPSARDPIKIVRVDKELGNEGFTYKLESGTEGTIHIDHVLHYNRDPSYQRDQLLYKLTQTTRQRVKSSSLSKRELIRRMGTSPSQFYRLLDQTNYSKTIDQMTRLLSILDCEVDIIVKKKRQMPVVPVYS